MILQDISRVMRITSGNQGQKCDKIWNRLLEFNVFDPEIVMEEMTYYLILNEYEGRYLNFIFEIDNQDFTLVDKKVGFNRSKMDFFKDERERFYSDFSAGGVGGTVLYIFDSTQKAESGGYDAAIIYWSKFVMPIENVIERLK